MFCCHTDHRGAPTRLTDNKGHLAWSAAYTAFGQAYPRGGDRLRHPLRLPGQYHDAETGLHQNRWHCYDPQRGRYLSPDPLGLAGGLNLYAYAGSDPVNGSDPLGLFPSVTDLASRVFGSQVNAHTAKAYIQVQNLLHPHLSPVIPPFMALGPSPFGPNGLGNMPLPTPLGQGLPAYNPLGLPSLGSLTPAPSHAQRAKHHPALAHHAPPPAKAAHACGPKAQAAPPHPHTPRPAPLPSDTTPIITARDFFGGIGTGVSNVAHFIQGSQDASLDMVNPIKIYQAAHNFGEHEAAIYIPDPDGHVEDGDAFAKKLGHDALDGLNPFNKPSAYATGGAFANDLAMLAPVAGEASALNDLRVG